MVIEIKKSLREFIIEVSMEIPAGEASISSSAIGPVLGQHGLNTLSFCNEFNEKTFYIKKGLIVFVKLYFYKNYSQKNFYFTIKLPIWSFIYYQTVFLYENQKNIIFNYISSKHCIDLEDFYLYYLLINGINKKLFIKDHMNKIKIIKGNIKSLELSYYNTIV